MNFSISCKMETPENNLTLANIIINEREKENIEVANFCSGFMI